MNIKITKFQVLWFFIPEFFTEYSWDTKDHSTREFNVNFLRWNFRLTVVKRA